MAKQKQRKQKPAQKPAPRQDSRLRAAISFTVVFAFAFLIRVVFLHSNLDRDWPFSIFYYGDAAHFHEYAVDLIEGRLYDNGIPYHPPLFAWLLSLIYRIQGIPTASGYACKLWLAALNAATVAMAWAWLRSMLPARWGWIAAGCLTFHFGWLVFSVTFNNETLYALLLTATAAICWRHRNLLSWKAALLLGICMAGGALTRAEHLGLWPFMMLFLWSCRDRKSSLRDHLLRWGASIAVSMLLILPWAIRNYRTIGDYNRLTAQLEPISRAALVTAYGPVNFALANNDSSDGGFRPDLLTQIGAQGKINLEDPRQRRYFIHGYAEGRRWIAGHPAGAARLAVRKIDRLLDAFRLGFGVSNAPAGLTGSRPPVDLFLPDTVLLKWPIVLLLAAGMALSFLPRYVEYRLCTLIVLHRLMITVLFFGYVRAMVMMLPVLLPLLLLPIVILAERIPQLRKATEFAFGAATLLLMMQAIAVVSGGPRNYVASGSVDDRGKIIQDDRVEIKLK